MTRLSLIAVFLAAAAAGSAVAGPRTWENPIYDSPEDAVTAAAGVAGDPQATRDGAEGMFVGMTLAEGDVGFPHPSAKVRRRIVDGILVTHPISFERNPPQALTVERFLAAVPRQRRTLESRLARFGYPALEGLVYLRLVESVDAFAGLGVSSERMSRVGGVTYYCRYVVLPLSYVSAAAVAELSRNPNIDVAGTIQRWQSESYSSLVNTFRHEMVHVRTNSALGVPAYSDRTRYPVWFHEGTATYLAGDPHAGLSERYKEYQNLFLYLAQRYGVADLQRYYRRVLGGSSAHEGLRDVYGIAGRSDFLVRSARWHRVIDRGKTVLWIGAMLIIVAAFRGTKRPTIGYLLVLGAVALILATATGLGEHLYGLRGPAAVLVAEIGFVVGAAVLAVLGGRRIRRFGERSRG